MNQSELLGPLEGQNVPVFFKDIHSFLDSQTKEGENVLPQDVEEARNIILAASVTNPDERKWLDSLDEEGLDKYSRILGGLKKKFYPKETTTQAYLNVDPEFQLNFLVTKGRRDEFVQFLGGQTFYYSTIKSRFESNQPIPPSLNIRQWGFGSVEDYIRFYELDSNDLEEIHKISKQISDEKKDDVDKADDLAAKAFRALSYFNYIFPQSETNDEVNTQRSLALQRLGLPEDLPYFNKMQGDYSQEPDWNKLVDSLVIGKITI